MRRFFREWRIRHLQQMLPWLEEQRRKAEARYDELGEAHYEMRIEMALRLIEDRIPPKKDPRKLDIWNFEPNPSLG